MLELNLTRQEKNVLLAIIFAALLGIGISSLFKVIPKAGKIYASISSYGPSMVNINTADKEQLITLPGIGPKTAQKIIDYRLKSGGFSHIDQLKQIKGIGGKKWERIRQFLTVDRVE